MFRYFLVALVFVATSAGPQPAHAQTSPRTPRGSEAGVQRLALVGGTLIDGFGSHPVRNSVILIEGERIQAVGTVDTLAVPEGFKFVSTEGMSLLPGLWDMHVHLMINGHADYGHWDRTYPKLFRSVIMPASAHQLLLAGITSARDLGAPLDDSIAVRDAINRGDIPGPTMYMSGPFIQHQPYSGTEQFRWGVKGADDARAKVRRLAEAGVDCIKLIDQDQMTMEEVMAVVEEAHAHDLTVVAHSHRPEEIKIGLAAGVDCFEHTGLATAPEYPEDVMAMIRERTAKMNLGPLFWTPTIEGLFNYEYVRDNPEKLDTTAWHLGLTPEIIEDIRSSFSHPRGQLELVRMYYGQLAKKGFVIDERFNGGGQLADRFLELMQRPVVYNLHWRHGKDHTYPVRTNTGPIGMLINGWAGSGGDGLPWAFQELEAGPIVGERTLGILVGPATGHRLIDGGSITVPGARLYDNDGHWFWEGVGVSPDFEVWDDPNILVKGRDPQIEKVVEEVLKLLKESPPAMTPAPAREDRTARGLNRSK